MAQGERDCPIPGARMATAVTTGRATATQLLAAGSLLPAPRPAASNPVQQPHPLISLVFRYVICKNKIIMVSLPVKIFTLKSTRAAADET